MLPFLAHRILSRVAGIHKNQVVDGGVVIRRAWDLTFLCFATKLPEVFHVAHTDGWVGDAIIDDRIDGHRH